MTGSNSSNGNLSEFSIFSSMVDEILGVGGRSFPSSLEESVVRMNASSVPHHIIFDNWTTPTSSELPIDSSLYASPAAVFSALVTFSVCTIFGNSLVMLAVKREHYLQSPPNYFVASLAAADFSVGVLIVPFEAITQLLNRRWIFGEIWCDLWHSFDVLLTTASILNLCVISLDRYWAICTPLHYSRRMTSKRAYRFIALVWICSTVISLPAIFWWRGVREGPVPPETCPFTEDVGYLISSSCISFYIPLSVMLFVNYKIYLAAVKQSKSIQQGAKLFAHGNGTEIKLRMHRGGSNGNSISSTSNNNVGSTSRKSFALPGTDANGMAMLRAASMRIRSKSMKASHFLRNKGKRTFSENSIPLGSISNLESGGSGGDGHNPMIPSIMADDERGESGGAPAISAAVRLISTPLVMITTAAGSSTTTTTANSPGSPTRNVPTVTFRHSRRSFTVARKLAKFAKEKKAAKTLGIVLGVFMICWLPFFVTNIVFALCKSCAENVMIFEVFTWLGWINSAMNPVIYALWSHDFRRAFVRLLCCRRCIRARQRRSFRRQSLL